MTAGSDRPSPAFEALTRAYGPPSSAGFGSAVFRDRVAASEDLEVAAQRCYRAFVGELWARFGEDAWMGPWRMVYQRPAGAARDVVNELQGIAGPPASSVDMLLNVVEGADQARVALAQAFDAGTIADLRVFSIGDGSAMSGILIAGRETTGEATLLILLMD